MDAIEAYFPLYLRLILGLSFFGVMGAIDYKKNPKNPVRLKEYLFIASLALIATVFGILHDAFTFSISHEYFEYGKGLGPKLSFFQLSFCWLRRLLTDQDSL